MPERPPNPYDFLPELPSFTLESDDIAHGEKLSNDYVHTMSGGANVSPELHWSGFPAETKSFTVTCYDPDAPTGSGFWHWIVFDIPANVTSLPHGAGSGDFSGLPAGAVQARNDYGTQDFGGAAPPPGHGPHRYIFTVSAVGQEKLGPGADATPAFVGFNLFMHAIARAQLIATYEA